MADNSVQVQFGGDASEAIAAGDAVKNNIGEVKDSGEELSSTFSKLTDVLAGAFAVDKIIEFTKGALDAANTLEILSQRTGIAASSLSALNIPLLQNGSSVEEFSSSMKFMSRNIEQAAEGNTTLIQKFDDLGLSVTKLKELSPEQQFDAIAQALAGVTDQSRFTNDMMGILGRGAQGLGPIIKETGGHIKDMTDHIKEMGGALTDEEIAKVHEYDDAWTSMWEHFKIRAVEATLALREFMSQSVPGGGGGESWEDKSKRLGFVTQATFQSSNPAAGGNSDIATKGPNVDDQIEQRDLETKLQLYREQISAKKDADDQMVAYGKLTRQQELADLIQFTTEQRDLSLAAVTSQQDEYDRDTKEWQAAQDKKLLIAQQYNNQIAHLTAQSAQEQMRDYHTLFQSIEQASSQMVSGILQGTQTWQQALARLFDNILIKFIDDFIIKRVVSWAESEVAMTSATVAGDTARTASNATASAASSGFSIAKAISHIETAAAETYGSVFAWASPELGPFAAIPAAAASALVIGKEALVGSFDVGTSYVPQTGLAMVHEGERIITAQDNAAGNYGGNINVTFQIQAIDTQTGANFIKSNAAAIAQTVAGQLRNGSNQLSKAMKA